MCVYNGKQYGLYDTSIKIILIVYFSWSEINFEKLYNRLVNCLGNKTRETYFYFPNFEISNEDYKIKRT